MSININVYMYIYSHIHTYIYIYVYCAQNAFSHAYVLSTLSPTYWWNIFLLLVDTMFKTHNFRR